MDRSIKQGYLVPSLHDKPELEAGSELIWDAFIATTTSRGTSIRFGKDKQYIVLDPIKLSEIVAYCVLVSLNDPDQRRRLARMVHYVDIAYLKQLNPKVV